MDAPPTLDDAGAAQPGRERRVVVGPPPNGIDIDLSSRASVALAFVSHAYQEPASNYTGDPSTCDPGTISAAYVNVRCRRLLSCLARPRALAGLRPLGLGRVACTRPSTRPSTGGIS